MHTRIKLRINKSACTSDDFFSVKELISFRINSRQGSPSDEVEVGGGIPPGAPMGPSPPAMNAAAAVVAHQQQAALQALQAQQLLHPEGNFPVRIPYSLPLSPLTVLPFSPNLLFPPRRLTL